MSPNSLGPKKVLKQSLKTSSPKELSLTNLETDLYHLLHKQEGSMGENHQKTITEDVKVPNPTMFSENLYPLAGAFRL